MSFMEGLFGDEFPEAFGSGAQNKKTITDLPTELLEIVCKHISGLDIKRLRLASKCLAASVYLLIDRIYVSPNRANLDYLHQILAHPTYRSRVREIVWDDARLNEYSTLERFRHAILVDEKETTRAIERRLEEAMEIYGDENPEYRSLEMEDLLEDGRLTEVAKGILLRYDDDFSRDVLARNATMMSIEDSYALYQELYHQEQDLMEQQVDATVFHQALAGFSNVRRITFTTDVWPARDVSPRYNTPYHRSLPLGFRKPAVWPWLRSRQESGTIHQQWFSRVAKPIKTGELLVGEHQSYGIVVSAILAMPTPRIEEFIVESEHQAAGYHHCLLIESSRKFQITKQMFQKTLLKHLKLIVTPPNNYLSDPAGLTCLLSLFAELKCLEHLDLEINDSRSGRAVRFFLPINPVPESVRLELKTLALRNVKLSEKDIYDLLTTCPNLQHVTLYHCHQRVRPVSMWPETFHELRKYYHRATDVSKPSFTVVVPLSRQYCTVTEPMSRQYSQLVDDEVDAFLYGNDDSECPFLKFLPDNGVKAIKPHMGWRVWDRDESVRERMTEVLEREERDVREEQ
jgi:hypothetical protein